MSARRRQFVLVCSLLVVVHLGSASALWLNSTDTTFPSPVAESPDADAVTLLATATHNDAAFATTSHVRVVPAGDETKATEIRTSIDPATGRVRSQVLKNESINPLVGEDVYITPWGQWTRDSDGWTYGSDVDGAYSPSSARILRPSPSNETDVAKTVHENGSVTITLRRSNPTWGMLSAAGSNVTSRYRIAFHDGQPYFAAASAEPTTEDGRRVTVERRRGADVQRPAGVPRFSARELSDRLTQGARNG